LHHIKSNFDSFYLPILEPFHFTKCMIVLASIIAGSSFASK